MEIIDFTTVLLLLGIILGVLLVLGSKQLT
jgi:hypothetical protein